MPPPPPGGHDIDVRKFRNLIRSQNHLLGFPGFLEASISYFSCDKMFAKLMNSHTILNDLLKASIVQKAVNATYLIKNSFIKTISSLPKDALTEIDYE